MKRRNFLKMLPVGFLAAKFGGLVELVKPKKTDFALFVEAVTEQIRIELAPDIPTEILEMEFNKEWSLSREVLLNMCLKPPSNPQFS